MSEHPEELEIWRSGPNPKARDVRLYRGLSKRVAQAMLDLCNKEQAETYPHAPIEFYIVRVSRERVVLPLGEGGDGDE